MVFSFLFFLFSTVSSFGSFEVGSEYSVFHQPGGRFSNQGYATLLTSRQMFRSGITLEQKAGYEAFMGMDDGHHRGLRVDATGMYVFSNNYGIEIGAGYRTLGNGWNDFE